MQLSLTLALLIASVGTAQASSVLIINRYAGMPDFSQSRQSVLVKDGEVYKKTDSPPLSDSFSCDIKFHMDQQFSLAQMVFRGYLDPANAEKYLGYLMQYRPEQITFLQISDTERERVPSLIPDPHPVIAVLSNTQIPVHATLSVVAGQFYDPVTHRFVSTPLPWQREEHLAHLALKLDRNKYRFVSEWGRAGQVAPDLAEEMIAVAALIQLQELHSIGLRAADGWVTLHSGDLLHSKLYNRRFPESLLGEMDPVTGEAVFVFPLLKALEVTRARKISPTLNALLAVGLSWDEAAYVQQFQKRMEVSDFDVSNHGELMRAPVTVVDYSDLLEQVVGEHLLGIGFSPERADDVQSILNQSVPEGALVRNPFDVDYAFMPSAVKELASQNSILLTNLDPIAAKNDSGYVVKMMKSVLIEKWNFLKLHDPAWTFQAFSKMLVDSDIRFSVYTRDDGIHQQLQRIFGNPIVQTVKVTGGRPRNALEIYHDVVKNGPSALAAPSETHYRYQFKMAELLDDFAFGPTPRWYEHPDFELNMLRFGIQRALMNVSGF